MPTSVEMRERTVSPYHLWSVDPFHRMAGSGLFDEADRVELIDGELVIRAPIGSRHAFLVDWLAECLNGAPHAAFMVRVQNAVVLDDRHEPQPDIDLVRRANYAGCHPGPADVLLIGEVSETTLEFDREVKLPLYAGHGIAAVWLVDVRRGDWTVYREPVEGGYHLAHQAATSARVEPSLLPGFGIVLAERLE